MVDFLYFLSMTSRKVAVLVIVLLGIVLPTQGMWGFFAHQKINRMAVFTLPVEMIGFYKNHIRFITENAVNTAI